MYVERARDSWRILAALSVGIVLACADPGGEARAETLDFGALRDVVARDLGGNRRPIEAEVLLGFEDFDGDGLRDLVVARSFDSYAVFVGDEADGFREVGGGALGWRASFGVAEDFDGDGRLDLAVTPTSAHEVGLLRGKGDGTFEDVRVFETGLIAGKPPYLVLVDLERDGHTDLVVFGFEATLLRNLEGRGFGPSEVVRNDEDRRSDRYVVGDFNCDGFVDLVRFYSISRDGEMLLSDGAGDFLEPVPLDVDVVGRVSELVALDVDLDGHLDLIFVTDEIHVAFGDGAGGFLRERLYEISSGGTFRAADFDHDGVVDFLVERSIYFGDGVGRYARRDDENRSIPAEVHEVADFDRDGHLDLLTTANQRLRGLPGTPFGRFLGDEWFVESAANLRTPKVLGDWNEDGRLDLAGFAQDDTSRFAWIAFASEAGEGEYGELQRLADLLLPTHVVSSDFNADGHLDLAFGGWILFPLIHFVDMFYGDGSGGFEEPVEVLRGQGVLERLEAKDLDEDGLPEIVLCTGDRVIVRRRESPMNYPIREELQTIRDPSAVVVDFDSDGNDDIVYPTRLELWVHLADEVGRISETRNLEVDLGTRLSVDFCEVLDFDGDGYDDLLLLGTEDSRWRIRSGRDGRMVSFEYRQLYERPISATLDSMPGDELVLTGQGSVEIHALDGDRVRTFGFRATDSRSTALVGDFDGDGRGDLMLPGNLFGFEIHRNRSFDAVDCRRGNVDARGKGPIDTLFVNDSAGGGKRRGLSLDADVPVTVRMDVPPSASGPAAFALWLWEGIPDATSVERLPARIGTTCLPIPWTRGARQSFVRWNNIGVPGRLGAPTKKSEPAPSVVYEGTMGLGPRFIGDFFLQGMIVDAQAPSRRAAITNGIAIRVE